MKQFFYLLSVTTLLLTSCTESFKKTTDGIEYKIISDGKGAKLESGKFFEIQFDQVYKGSNKDTVLFDSRNLSNQVVMMDSVRIPPVYYKIFSQVRKGDSVVVKQLTDSIMKGGNIPPFMKKGNHIIAHYKIVNIFDKKEQADSAYKAQMLMAKAKDSVLAIEQLKKDDVLIKDYLAKNKIQAEKAPRGTYVQILSPGEGDPLDSSKVLKVFYTGKTMTEGKVFDSNIDPKFGHPEAYPVNLSPEAPVIKGWVDGLSLLRKGSKAVLYVPSSLAYGKQGAGGDIKPNANLIFDVEVREVITTAEARAEGEIKRKEFESKQKLAMDSIQKEKKERAAERK